MKSFGEILKELGFNENAPESVQKAFFKHLAQQAVQDCRPIQAKKNEQLSLDFDAVDAIVCTYNNKKVS